MEMHCGLFLFQKDNAVSRRFMADWQIILGIQIQLDLMIGTTKGGERNSVPASAYRSVNMSEKKMFDV